MTFETIQVKALPTTQIQPAAYYDKLLFETRLANAAPEMLELLKRALPATIFANNLQSEIQQFIKNLERV